jgi:hypothetical protein
LKRKGWRIPEVAEGPSRGIPGEVDAEIIQGVHPVTEIFEIDHQQ